MALYVTTFEVCGKQSFPLDMLRFDRCFPARGEDAAAIERCNQPGISIREKVASLPEGFFRIRLECVGTRQGPTEGRWASWGWTVDHDTVKTGRLPR